MKIYTRTGDDGTTGLFGGTRIGKASPRIEAYGTVDELNAAIGLAASATANTDLAPVLHRLQSELFVLGAELATTAERPPASPGNTIGPPHAQALEREIDVWQDELEPLRNFILPGGTAGAAGLHLARTICRRAERRVLELAALEPVAPDIIRYLNRLSDHLFVAARVVNRRASVADVIWRVATAPTVTP